jgi:hypothetical protein
MSLVKQLPSTSSVIIPVDLEELPKLPNAVRELDEKAVEDYENKMRSFWIRITDAINSISAKVES